jgi:hypothetical protein
MDALIKATQALIEARDELFEHNMRLEWELKISYIDTDRIKSMYPPPLPECTSQNGGSEK